MPTETDIFRRADIFLVRPTKITRIDFSADEMWEKYKSKHDGRMKERYHCIAMMLDGATPGEVAKVFHCSRNTTWEWAVAYNEGGLEGLERESPPGLKSRLSDEQKAALKEDLKKSPRDLGYSFSTWTGKSFGFHILQQYSIEYGERAVEKLIKSMNFTLQRPTFVHPKADPVVQARAIEDIKKN